MPEHILELSSNKDMIWITWLKHDSPFVRTRTQGAELVPRLCKELRNRQNQTSENEPIISAYFMPILHSKSKFGAWNILSRNSPSIQLTEVSFHLKSKNRQNQTSEYVPIISAYFMPIIYFKSKFRALNNSKVSLSIQLTENSFHFKSNEIEIKMTLCRSCKMK